MLSKVRAVMLCATVLLSGLAGDKAAAQANRDHIYIVGSSTVYPFSTVAAERFGRASRFKTPKVESTGSGGGLKLFCDGVGADYPDIVSTSRGIKSTELARCASNGVHDIVEVKIGYDGIVIATSVQAATVALSREEVFLALAKRIPAGDSGQLVDNPYQSWADVNPALPDTRIEVLGPPPTSGTRDALVELVMEGGCRAIPWIAALEADDPVQFRTICHTVREDGAYIEAGENDNLIVQKLEANPKAFGIFGYSFLDQNGDKVKGTALDDVMPTFDAIAVGDYPVSRPLYLYVKKAHVDVIPGLRELLREISSERAWGDEGYLADRGLVPMPAAERRQIAANVRALTTVQLAVE